MDKAIIKSQEDLDGLIDDLKTALQNSLDDDTVESIEINTEVIIHDKKIEKKDYSDFNKKLNKALNFNPK